MVNSLGRKWELTFTTLVLFGGALFAAFPKFYATSFGGAYWVWMLILFTFIGQAVSYEYRRKPDNLLGERGYEILLFINGSVGVLLIGVAVGSLFTGAQFSLNEYNQVSWTGPFRGVEAAFSPFNLALGLFLVFNARVLGAMYLVNNIELRQMAALERRLRSSCLTSFIIALPFLLYFLVSLLLIDGYRVAADGVITRMAHGYLHSLLAMPVVLGMLLLGLVLVLLGVTRTGLGRVKNGIWFGGPGTILVGLAIFLVAGLNDAAFYPSQSHPQSSLTINNASSSHYTLAVMGYVALGIPLVLAYIAYVWRKMDGRKIDLRDIDDDKAY